MKCGFSEKCRHYNAWWCDHQYENCSVAADFRADKKISAPAAKVTEKPAPKRTKKGGEK